MDSLVMKVSKDLLLGRRGGSGKRQAKVFVAYRMNDKASRQFRQDIEVALRKHGKVQVLDGKVEDGDPWAPKIRKRIKDSHLVVADVTGPSKEVLFELGFAGGKSLLPVVESGSHRARLPGWLTAVQIPAFDGLGTTQIAQTAWERVSNQRIRGTPRPAAVPGRVVWLQNEDGAWCDESFSRFQNLCSERSLTVERVFPDDLSSSEDLRTHLRAWLVVACVDGGTQDYAAHYFAGDVVSRRLCGSVSGARQRVARGMIIFANDEWDLRSFVADSVVRVSKNSVDRVSGLSGLLGRTRKHLDRYRRWLAEDRR